MALVAVAVLAFLLAGTAQSVTGFGSSLVAAPLLAMVTGVATTVVAVTLVSLGLTAWAGRRERAYVDGRLALRTALAGMAGLPFGLLLLHRAGDAVLGDVMAGTVLVALALMAADVRLPASRATAWTTGATSGVLLAATGMNGPPLVLGLSAHRLAPRSFRGTLQVVLCVQDVAAVAGFLVVGVLGPEALGLAAIGIVASPVGWVLGDRVFDRIPAAQFRRILVAALVASAALLLVRR